jgi:hypothetical protein
VLFTKTIQGYADNLITTANFCMHAHTRKPWLPPQGEVNLTFMHQFTASIATISILLFIHITDLEAWYKIKLSKNIYAMNFKVLSLAKRYF